MELYIIRPDKTNEKGTSVVLMLATLLRPFDLLGATLNSNQILISCLITYSVRVSIKHSGNVVPVKFVRIMIATSEISTRFPYSLPDR